MQILQLPMEEMFMPLAALLLVLEFCRKLMTLPALKQLTGEHNDTHLKNFAFDHLLLRLSLSDSYL